MLLGGGELGKEVLIALQRLGVETIAVDRYEHAPGQQVAHHARTISMSDPDAAARADRGRAARSGGAGDRSHRHPGAAGAGGRRRGARHPHRARGPADDGSRRHPPPGRRNAGPADQSVPLLRFARRVALGHRWHGVRRRRRAGHRLPVHRQAGDEQLGQGPEQDRRPCRRAARVGLRDGRWPRQPAGASSSKASSTSTTRSRCSRCVPPTAPISASRSAMCRWPATMSKAGSRTPWRRRRCSAHARSPRR